MWLRRSKVRMKRQAAATNVFMSTAPGQAENNGLRNRIRDYECNQLAQENAAAAAPVRS